MPKGVEHFPTGVVPKVNAEMIISVMPKGVEHESAPGGVQQIECDHLCDAERR